MQASDVQRGFLDNSFRDEYNQEELTFWIDPLDGSSGLTEGHTEHLTVIIGVALNKRPLLGIVHKPFYQEQSGISSDSDSASCSASLTGRTFIGMPESGLFTVTTKGGSGFSKASPMYIPPLSRGDFLKQDSF